MNGWYDFYHLPEEKTVFKKLYQAWVEWGYYQRAKIDYRSSSPVFVGEAIKKVNGRKENDLCKYIPGSGGGYMHHFTLKKMKSKKEDPELFYLDLEDLNLKFSEIGSAYRKSEVEIKTKMLLMLPEEYSEVVTNQMEKIETSTAQSIKKEVIEFYKHKFKKKTLDDATEKEVQLAQSAGTSKRECYYCHKKRHIAKKCLLRKTKRNKEMENPKKNKFKGKCHNCGKPGHKEADCWEKEENAHKCLNNFRVANERNNIHVNMIEVQLSAYNESASSDKSSYESDGDDDSSIG